MPLGSKISSLCSVSSPWLDVELFNVAVALIGLFTDAKGPGGEGRQGLSLSPLRSHRERTRDGRGGHILNCIHTVNGTNGDSLAWCEWDKWHWLLPILTSPGLREDKSTAPCFVSFCLIQPFVLQFSVQGYKLSQEAPVWENPAFLLHTACRGQKTEVVMNHQVGKDQGSRATHTHSTVHKHPSWKSQKTQTRTLKTQQV